ncbi:MAG: hypothetical protein ACRDNF_07480 [Streptosporangiaceae bacterium]
MRGTSTRMTRPRTRPTPAPAQVASHLSVPARPAKPTAVSTANSTNEQLLMIFGGHDRFTARISQPAYLGTR